MHTAQELVFTDYIVYLLLAGTWYSARLIDNV